MRKVLVSVITSLLNATCRWGLGVEKSKQLGDQESGDWGSGPCSASNLLCDFELLASPFWNLISKLGFALDNFYGRNSFDILIVQSLQRDT